MNYPELSILLLTYARTAEAERTVVGLCEHLDYPNRGWYIADDGSGEEHVEILLEELSGHGEKIIGWLSQRYSPHTGVGWNKGLGICFQNSDYVLVMEDDWELSGNYDMNAENHPGLFVIAPNIQSGKFNISPYIEMLSQREDVGMVRLGGLAVGNNVEIVGHNGHHYLRYLKDRQYAYSGNPHLRHARFMRAYGWYSEGKLNPGELELEYDARIRSKDGPDIWRPSDIPGWGIFHHIGEMRYR